MLLGAIAIRTLPVSQYPNISRRRWCNIAGNYTGADAQTVEQTVATPWKPR